MSRPTQKKRNIKQRIYKMKGCSKKGNTKTRVKKTRRKYLGGSGNFGPNFSRGINNNLDNNVYPNPGPLGGSVNFLNSGNQSGGCGCGITNMIGGGRRSRGIRGQRRPNNTKRQRGGNLSNFFTQDLVNLGRQTQFGLGSAYNALRGYSAPTSPMPWKDQMPNTTSLNTSRLDLI